MEPQCYQVKVLHYLNPHLIWVEVLSSSDEGTCRQDLFEQVGVYGVLPLDTSIDIMEDSIATCKSQEWCCGVVSVMDDVLKKAKSVWFSPMFQDYRTSIFDNNIHKYGKFVVLNAKGDLVDLSNILINTSFAFYDENLFIHELTTFQIKTHITKYQAFGVLRAIEHHYNNDQTGKLKALKDVTSIIQAEQVLETELAEQIRPSKKVLPLTSENLRKTLQRKQRDFQQCKNIDDFSVGRGTAPRTYALEPKSPGKSTDLSQATSDSHHDPSALFQHTKKMLLAMAKAKTCHMQETPVASPEKSNRSELSSLVKDIGSEQWTTQEESYGDNSNQRVKSLDSMVSPEKPYRTKEIIYSNNDNPPLLSKSGKNGYDREEKGNVPYYNATSQRRNVKYSLNSQLNDEKTNLFEEEQCVESRPSRKEKKNNKSGITVVYGPPEIDLTKLIPKVVPNLPDDKLYSTNNTPVEDEPEERPKNSLQGLDSEVDYRLSNRDYLRSKLQSTHMDEPSGECHKTPGGQNTTFVRSKENVTHVSISQSHSEYKSEQQCLASSVESEKTPNVSIKAKPKTSIPLSQNYALNSLLLKKKLTMYKDMQSKPLKKSKMPTQSHHRDATSDILTNGERETIGTLCKIELNKNPAVAANMLKKKLVLLKKSKQNDSSSTTSDTSQKDMSTSSNEDYKSKNLLITKPRQEPESDSDESTLAYIEAKLKLDENKNDTPRVEVNPKPVTSDKNHVNPFKNLDATISKFVEKLVSPVLMVHTKQDRRIQPVYDLSEVNFTAQIHRALKEISVKNQMTLQTVTWPSILRGYSLFMVSPTESGKTLGYVPAVCRLVADFDKEDIPHSVGPIAIIVCATATSVIEVERLCRRMMVNGKTILSGYAGVDEKELTMSLLNGCDIFVCTPAALARLLSVTDFGVDLRRLTTFVLDDCERLSEVYLNEIKYFLIKIKDMLRNRADKVLKVHYIVSSRIWCDFMEHLAAKAPNPMICIGSFQECVLYSKSGMSVNFISKEKKTDVVMDFMLSIDLSKMTVVVCRTDNEVDTVSQLLKKHKHVVFVGKNSQSVEDLYALSKNWSEYKVPLVGAVLVCCDSNLTELNITNAHNLLHYSLPNLFSLFSRRFAVLIDHYPSMFKDHKEAVKIKILLDESNIEQLPKILHFIKRCTTKVPVSLDAICDQVLADKDADKAKRLVPICDNILALGECPNFWNCRARHTIFKDCDVPKHGVPKIGHITFKILHYQTAVKYSARLISNIVNGKVKEYDKSYSTLPLKMGMYYTKEANRRPHGIPEVGDVCAVAIRENFFERCQVRKVLNRYDKSGNPNHVLVNLIDEEKWETTRDVHLYHLPEELKNINTHVVLVQLAGVQPKDRDITFSGLATYHLQTLIENNDNVYMRAKVVFSINNTVFIDDLEACQDLTSMGETVVRFNLREELLKTHAVPNSDHVKRLQELCERNGLDIKLEKDEVEVAKVQVKVLPEPQWAHLDKGVDHLIYFASADNPDTFFIRLEKYEDCLDVLTKDIQKYVAEEKAVAMSEVSKDDIVLAKFPDDLKYYRARIDKVLDNNKVKCFFVDHGDWRHVDVKDLREMTANFVTKLPFQAIECRLIGIKPVGSCWSEYSTNWLCDQCFEGTSNDLKKLYVKYFTKELAECTGGHKYGIALIDTTTEKDIVVNKSMIDYNLASENEEESEFLELLEFKRKEIAKSDSEDEDWVKDIKETPKGNSDKSLEIVQTKQPGLDQIFLKKPIRSVPLVSSSSDISDEWDIQFTTEELKPIFKQATSNCVPQDAKATVSDISPPCVPAILPDIPKISQKSPQKDDSSISEYEVIPSSKNIIQELDSDDYTSPELTDLDTSITKLSTDEDALRKPKVHWRQKQNYVAIKILLIGVKDYDMHIDTRTVTFRTNLFDTEYGFELDLYGVVNPKLSTHASKGQYVYVKLAKLLKKPWQSLTQDSVVKKWIVYDPDFIVASSDDEDEDHVKKDILKKIIINDDDSDDDCEDLDELLDDLNFRHKYHRDSD